jgi:hypothetical protein
MRKKVIEKPKISSLANKIGVSYDEYRIACKLETRGDFGPWYTEYRQLIK